MKKRWLLLISVLFLSALLIPIASAQSLNITSRSLKDRISKGEWAAFDIIIHNNQNVYDTFTINSKAEGTEWSILTESTIDYTTGIAIGPHTYKVIRMQLKDKDLAVNPHRAYLVDLTAESVNTGEKATTYLQVFIVAAPNVSYEPNISVILNFPRYIDPFNIYSFIVNIKNNNPKDIRSMKITLESNLVNRESVVELGPNVQKAVEMTAEFDERQPPVLDTVIVTVTESGKILYREAMPIEVVSYRLPFDKQSTLKKKFLFYVETIILTNNENVPQQQKLLIPLSWFDSFFTKSDPESAFVDKEGKGYMQWSVRLSPQESQKIVVVRNYLTLLYSFIALVFILVVYYVFRNPVIVRKHAENIKTKEGGLSEMKIVVEMKNRSRSAFKKVTLVDRVPHMIEVEKQTEVGTLPPKKILHTKKGTLLTWEFFMEPKEERLVKYMIRPKLSILGGMRLPAAALFLHGEGDTKRKIKSNEANITGE